jgi:hypothetical protein
MKPSLIVTSILALAALPQFAAAQVRASTSASASARVEASTATRSGASGAEPARPGQPDGARASTAGEAALQAAAQERLPAGPVQRVIAEGRARGASRVSIDRAAAGVEARLSASREALQGSGASARRASDAEITAGAEALATGASVADLSRVRDSAPPSRSLTASLQALARLSAGGVPSGQAAAAVAAQLRAGASDETLTSLTTGASGALHGAGAAGALGTGTSALGASAGVAGSLTAGLGH